MIHSFLLIGQSNMAGRGFLNEAEDIDSSRIKILVNGRWQDMFRPINPDRSFSGVSLAESFAQCYVQKHNTDVGLICCADGGTSIDQWKKGELLYDNAVFQAKLAKRTSKIKGILWHQGETDCPQQSYPTYEKRLKEMMNELRKDLDLYDVPFLIGGLGDFLKDCVFDENLKNYTHINEALIHTAQTTPLTGFVSAEGLTSNPDNLHFNAKSLYVFGKRYFDEFEKLNTADNNDEQVYHHDNLIRTKMELL